VRKHRQARDGVRASNILTSNTPFRTQSSWQKGMLLDKSLLPRFRWLLFSRRIRAQCTTPCCQRGTSRRQGSLGSLRAVSSAHLSPASPPLARSSQLSQALVFSGSSTRMESCLRPTPWVRACCCRCYFCCSAGVAALAVLVPVSPPSSSCAGGRHHIHSVCGQLGCIQQWRGCVCKALVVH